MESRRRGRRNRSENTSLPYRNNTPTPFHNSASNLTQFRLIEEQRATEIRNKELEAERRYQQIRMEVFSSIAANRRNWSNERLDSAPVPAVEFIPVYESDGLKHYNYNKGEENETCERKRSRSPVTRLIRRNVEDSAPKRNFGDNYDPVHSKLPNPLYAYVGYLNKSDPLNLTAKAETRRIVYKAPTSADEVHQIRRHRQSDYETEDSSYRTTHANDDYVKEDEDVETDHKYSTVHVFPSSENYQEEQEYNSNVGREKESFITPRVSSEQEIGINSSLVKRGYQPERELEDRRKMFSKKWVEVDESRTLPPGNESDDDYDDDFGESARNGKIGTLGSSRFNGFTRTVDNRSNVASATKFEAQSSTPVEPVASTSGRSSWMDYTQGTGFFQSAKDQGTATKSYIDESTTRGSGNQLNNQKIKCTMAWNNTKPCLEVERAFWKKVDDLDYFFKLTSMPIENENGTNFYTYKLEFWPLSKRSNQELVYGLRTSDPMLARETVFAAGLRKLDDAKTDYSSLMRLRAKVFGNKITTEINDSSPGLYGMPLSTPTRKVLAEPSLHVKSRQIAEEQASGYEDHKTILNAPKPSNPRPRYNLDYLRSATPSKLETKMKAEMQDEKPTASLVNAFKDDYEKPFRIDAFKDDKEEKPFRIDASKADKEEKPFRIAIPRERSIIDEQFHHYRRAPPPTQYDMGKRRHGYAHQEQWIWKSS